MKLKHFVFLFLLLAGMGCNRNNVSIRGLIEGGDEQILLLERLDVNRTSVIDSVQIKKGGTFTLSIKLEEPELFILRYSNGEIVNLLISPGENINLSTKAESFGSNYVVEGSEESKNLQVLVEQLNTTRTQLDSLSAVAVSIGDPESPHMELVRTAYAQAIVNQKRFTIRYLVGHMTSLSSVYALYQKYDAGDMVMGLQSDLQYFKVVADSLETAHPNSSLTVSLRNDITNLEAQFQRDKKINTLLEMADETTGIPDLSIPDREGREISLSSYKGKVVQLVFWASGNEASVNMLLQLKSTYERYHAKGFEVYAISLDNNKIQWMNSMDFNEFDWVNVSELTYPESRASTLYNVTSLPSGFLINREGDIVSKNIFGKTLETWLDNLL